MEEQNNFDNKSEITNEKKPLFSKMKMIVAGLVLVGVLAGLNFSVQLSSKKELTDTQSQAQTNPCAAHQCRYYHPTTKETVCCPKVDATNACPSYEINCLGQGGGTTRQTTILGSVVTEATSTTPRIYYMTKQGSCTTTQASQHTILPSLNVNILYSGSTTSHNLQQCDTSGKAFYTTGPVYIGNRTITLSGLPAGYACDGWHYALYDKNTKVLTSIRRGTGCSMSDVFNDLNEVNANYNNEHRVSFFIKKSSVTPSSTPVPTRAIITEAPYQPITDDVVLIIDRSSSMLDDNEDNDPNRLGKAKIAAKSFIDTIANSAAGKAKTIRIGIVSFGKTGKQVQALTTDYRLLKTQVDTIVNDGKGTCVACGQVLASNLMSNTKPGVKKYQILLSDGRANRMLNGTTNSSGTTGAPKEMLDQATKDKTNGTLIYVMAYGGNAQVSRLKTVASDPDKEYYAYNKLSDIWKANYVNWAGVVANP